MDEERFEQLYNKILDGDDWDYYTLDELICLVKSGAREEGRQEMKKKAINALFQSTIAFPNDTDIKALEKQKEIFIEKVNS